MCSIALVRCGQDTYLGVGAAAGDGVAAVAVAVAIGGLGRHFCLGIGCWDLDGFGCGVGRCLVSGVFGRELVLEEVFCQERTMIAVCESLSLGQSKPRACLVVCFHVCSHAVFQTTGSCGDAKLAGVFFFV